MRGKTLLGLSLLGAVVVAIARTLISREEEPQPPDVAELRRPATVSAAGMATKELAKSGYAKRGRWAEVRIDIPPGTYVSHRVHVWTQNGGGKVLGAWTSNTVGGVPGDPAGVEWVYMTLYGGPYHWGQARPWIGAYLIVTVKK
jgi:hypothetical protein